MEEEKKPENTCGTHKSPLLTVKLLLEEVQNVLVQENVIGKLREVLTGTSKCP